MKKSLLALSACAFAIVSGCGGGGSSNTPDAGNPLAKYIGTYTYCDGHERGTLEIKDAGGTAVTMAIRWDYYKGPLCTGTIAATELPSAAPTGTYVSTGSATVTGYPATNSTATYTVDRISIAMPANTITLTGPGVQNTASKQCILYDGGEQVCFAGGTYPESVSAQTFTGGLVLTDTILMTLSTTATGYERDFVFSR